MTPDLKEKMSDLIEEHNQQIVELLDNDPFGVDTPTFAAIDRAGAALLAKIEKLDFEPEEITDIVIQCDSMVLRQKIEAFLQTEIYPFNNDYSNKITI